MVSGPCVKTMLADTELRGELGIGDDIPRLGLEKCVNLFSGLKFVYTRFLECIKPPPKIRRQRNEVVIHVNKTGRNRALHRQHHSLPVCWIVTLIVETDTVYEAINAPRLIECRRFTDAGEVKRIIRLKMDGRHNQQPVSANGRFLRHRFSSKSTNVAAASSLPKRNHVAKEAVSAAWQTNTRQRSKQIPQTERYSKDEAAALRKNHVVRLYAMEARIASTHAR